MTTDNTSNRSYKDEANVAGTNYTNWSYYEMDPAQSNTLIGTGNNTWTLNLTHMPSNLKYGLQVGEAANSKNTLFGMSAWFNYTSTNTTKCPNGQGDINTRNECTDNVCNGQALVSVSGNNSGNYSIIWSTGTNEDETSLIALCPGDYSVTVTDVENPNCNEVVEFTIGCSTAPLREDEISNNEPSIVSGAPTVSAYPNPFATAANIDFTMPTDDEVTLEVYTVTGIKVAQFFRGEVKAGVKTSTKFVNENLAEGMYIYRIISNNNGTITGNLVIVR